MRIARIAAPVTTLGPGRRVALWVQGCTLGCTGCASRDTWSDRAGSDVPVEEVTRRLVDAVDAHSLQGVTITGGEPLQQATAVTAVLRGVTTRRPALDVLLFTGYPPTVARSRGAGVLDRCDVVVAGPYRPGTTGAHPLLASDNQELLVLTERGRRRLAQLPVRRPLQVTAHDGDLYVVGLPGPGDLERAEELLRERGVELGAASWRS